MPTMAVIFFLVMPFSLRLRVRFKTSSWHMTVLAESGLNFGNYSHVRAISSSASALHVTVFKCALRSEFQPGSTRWAVRLAQWRAMGIPEEDFHKPKIAVVNS